MVYARSMVLGSLLLILRESHVKRYSVQGFGIMSATNQNPFAVTSARSIATVAESSSASSSSSSSSSPSSSSSSSSSYEVADNGIYIVNKVPEHLPNNLKHRYFLLRHGQSEGNVEGVISSARSLATTNKHGLTPVGIEQGGNSAENLLQIIGEHPPSSSNKNKHKVYFYSSPFARAIQTAEACLAGLVNDENNVAKILELNLDIQKDNILIEDGIMERWFGDLDGEPLSTYGCVWPKDMIDPTQTGKYNVESVAAVATRVRETILRIEDSELHNTGSNNNEGGDIIVLVSHADTLQILQTYASGLKSIGDFSSYRFANGEVRYMGRTTDTLPEPQPLELPSV